MLEYPDVNPVEQYAYRRFEDACAESNLETPDRWKIEIMYGSDFNGTKFDRENMTFIVFVKVQKYNYDC
jgi:hypothetical protein